MLQADQALAGKQAAFREAMARYEGRPIYKGIDRACSVLNLGLQAVLLWKAFSIHLPLGWLLLALVLAYVLADFFNGLTHLLMDHADQYASFVGPLIAKFHLHHKLLYYPVQPLPVVYFQESGAKIWMVFYLAALLAFARHLPPFALHLLTYVAIWSSVAEVSHYLCHNSNAKAARWLAEAGLLLRKPHHAAHHQQDNTRYCFLNGMADPLVDWIARKWFRGYKNDTDLHFLGYSGVLDNDPAHPLR